MTAVRSCNQHRKLLCITCELQLQSSFTALIHVMKYVDRMSWPNIVAENRVPSGLIMVNWSVFSSLSSRDPYYKESGEDEGGTLYRHCGRAAGSHENIMPRLIVVAAMCLWQKQCAYAITIME